MQRAAGYWRSSWWRRSCWPRARRGPWPDGDECVVEGDCGYAGRWPDRWPFWLDAGLSPTTVGYAGALTLLAAIIVGVVPGLKVIGRGMSDRRSVSRAPEAGAYGWAKSGQA